MFGLLQRYTAAAFLRSFAFTGLVLTTVVFSLIMADKGDDLLENNASTKQAFTYFACVLPQAVLIVFPAVCLIGALFGMLVLSRQNELAAMYAAGASLRWLVGPTLVVSFLLAVGCFVWNEYVAAPLSRKAEQFWTTEIEKKKGIFQDYGLVRGTKNRFIRYGDFNRESETLTDFVLHEMRLGGKGHRRFIRAAVASWDPKAINQETGKPGAWRLFTRADTENYVLEFRDEWRTDPRPIAEGEILSLEETPDDFGIDRRHPIEMGYRELKKKIQDLEQSGGSALTLYSDLEFKIAFPFAVVALILIGLGSGASSFLLGREGAARFTYPLGVCLVVLALYYSVAGISLALGNQGILPAVVSAWVPNALFGALGVWMLTRG
ncbi:MAG: YjgP/YjgQ family permease [Candidatus Omnitrophica bacterium]|nr:hypothetical protein [bacterium]NUN97745.1 YjgP/YjgQ family permease [Candidatus Omnitrophota bacterium]